MLKVDLEIYVYSTPTHCTSCPVLFPNSCYCPLHNVHSQKFCPSNPHAEFVTFQINVINFFSLFYGHALTNTLVIFGNSNSTDILFLINNSHLLLVLELKSFGQSANMHSCFQTPDYLLLFCVCIFIFLP